MHSRTFSPPRLEFKMSATVKTIAVNLGKYGLAPPLIGAPIAAAIQGESIGIGLLQEAFTTGAAMAGGQGTFMTLAYAGGVLPMPFNPIDATTKDIVIASLGSAVAAEGTRMLISGGGFNATSAAVMTGAFLAGNFGVKMLYDRA